MNTTTRPTSDHDSILSITFSGPLVYVLELSDDASPAAVTIWVPYCPLHTAGFFFSDGSLSEVDLWKRAQSANAKPSDRRYKIAIDDYVPNGKRPEILPASPRTVCTSGKDFNLEETPFCALRGSQSLRDDKVMFRVTVPVPHYIYPLYFDCVEIVPSANDRPSSSTGSMRPYCTSLRFLYPWKRSSKVELTTPCESFDITPPVLSGISDTSDILFRYEGLSLLDENDSHSDARSCFASMATLVGETMWLNYGDGITTPTSPCHPGSATFGQQPFARPRLFIHTGGDCYAPAIVVGLA